MKPLPPASATARCRATVSGSSGRGNGIRSMITSWQVAPGTSTPCHSDSVPNRLVASSATNRRVSSRELGVALAEDRQLRQLLADVHRRRLGRPSGREQPQGPAARGPDQLGDLGHRRRPTARPARAAAASGRRRGCPAGGSRTASRRRDPATARPVVVRRRPSPGGPHGGRAVVVPVPLAQPEPSWPTPAKSPPSFSVAEVSTVVRSPNTCARISAGHRQRRHPGLPPAPFPLGHPDHVVLRQRGHPLGDVEDLLHGGRGLALLRARACPSRSSAR